MLGWEAGVPSSKRIVEDMAQIMEYSIPKRYSMRGVIVHGCGTCRGQRFEAGRVGENRGGRRTKKYFQPAFIHKDALLAVNESLTSSQNKWIKNQEVQGIGRYGINIARNNDSDDDDDAIEFI